MHKRTVISRIEVYKMLIPLIEPFVISLGPVDSAENIIVIIKTNTGITGYGESSPYALINGETIETCFIVAQSIGKILLDQDPLDIEDCSLRMDNLIYGNSSIKSAFDMALHDIASQDAHLPLYKFLGGNNSKVLTT